jgi:hypothetical protein
MRRVFKVPTHPVNIQQFNTACNFPITYVTAGQATLYTQLPSVKSIQLAFRAENRKLNNCLGTPLLST